MWCVIAIFHSPKYLCLASFWSGSTHNYCTAGKGKAFTYLLGQNKQTSPTTNLIHIDQEPVDRLGTVAEGRGDESKDDQESLKSHDFFKEIDWTALEEVKNEQ